MKTFLKVLYAVIFAVMLTGTIQASMDRGVFTALRELWGDPWVRVTLYDAYFAFLTIYVWIAWRERSPALKVVWFFLIMLLGNLAIAVYMLIRVCRLKPGDSLEKIVMRDDGGAA